MNLSKSEELLASSYNRWKLFEDKVKVSILEIVTNTLCQFIKLNRPTDCHEFDCLMKALGIEYNN